MQKLQSAGLPEENSLGLSAALTLEDCADFT